MLRERLTQRDLALAIGVSQGHLSKLLRGRIQRETRLFSLVESWAAGSESAVEAQLLHKARLAVHGQPRGMELLMRLMHIIAEFRREPRDRRSAGRHSHHRVRSKR